jgi:hypothetical protein
MQRPDYYAGQISLDAHNLVAAAMQAHSAVQQAPLGLPGEAHRAGPKVGALQRVVLEHSKKIHGLRMAAIPAQLRLTRYRKAMWANQRATALANQRTALVAAHAMPAALGAAGVGQGSGSGGWRRSHNRHLTEEAACWAVALKTLNCTFCASMGAYSLDGWHSFFLTCGTVSRWAIQIATTRASTRRQSA